MPNSLKFFSRGLIEFYVVRQARVKLWSKLLIIKCRDIFLCIKSSTESNYFKFVPKHFTVFRFKFVKMYT
jgi:hypothetical protein